MVEGFFLDRIDIFSDGLTVDHGEEFTPVIFSHSTTTQMTIGDQTVKTAEVAAYPALIEHFPEFCGMEVHRAIITEQIAVSCKLLRETLQPYSL